jgi:hypothetical protein
MIWNTCSKYLIQKFRYSAYDIVAYRNIIGTIVAYIVAMKYKQHIIKSVEGKWLCLITFIILASIYSIIYV